MNVTIESRLKFLENLIRTAGIGGAAASANKVWLAEINLDPFTPGAPGTPVIVAGMQLTPRASGVFVFGYAFAGTAAGADSFDAAGFIYPGGTVAGGATSPGGIRYRVGSPVTVTGTPITAVAPAYTPVGGAFSFSIGSSGPAVLTGEAAVVIVVGSTAGTTALTGAALSAYAFELP